MAEMATSLRRSPLPPFWKGRTKFDGGFDVTVWYVFCSVMCTGI